MPDEPRLLKIIYLCSDSGECVVPLYFYSLWKIALPFSNKPE